MRLCGGNGLLEDAGTHGDRSGSTCGHPVYRASDNQGISSINSSCVVKDDASGLTYVDTVTTSVGQIILSGPDLKGLLHRPYHRGHHQPGVRSQLKPATGQMSYHPSLA